MNTKLRLLICTFFVEFVIFSETRRASITEYSYQVSIQEFERHVCSGALIYESWILTAASCVFESEPSNVKIRVRTSSLVTGGDNLDVSYILVHDEFDKYVYTNDIALIKLKIPAMFGEKLQPIALPEHDDFMIEDKRIGFVTGWRRKIFQNTPVESELSVISVEIVNQETCATVMPSYKPVSEKMLCAGNMTQGVETCQGDPGAPLMLDQTLIGILSYGLGCETMLHPGVYTRISSYLEWIALSSGIH